MAFPLFLFCMIWGYHYTRNRKIYLLRLYLGSLFMTAFMYVIGHYLPTDGFGYGYHNIFLNMFWVGLLISTIETFQKDRKKGGIMLGTIFAAQILFPYAERILRVIFPFLPGLSGDTIAGIIPNIYLNEYGFEFIALGVLMYFADNDLVLRLVGKFPVYDVFHLGFVAFIHMWLVLRHGIGRYKPFLFHDPSNASAGYRISLFKQPHFDFSGTIIIPALSEYLPDFIYQILPCGFLFCLVIIRASWNV